MVNKIVLNGDESYPAGPSFDKLKSFTGSVDKNEPVQLGALHPRHLIWGWSSIQSSEVNPLTYEQTAGAISGARGYAWQLYRPGKCDAEPEGDLWPLGMVTGGQHTGSGKELNLMPYHQAYTEAFINALC